MKTKILLLKIYLKSLKKPVIAELNNESFVERFYDMLMTQNIIKFGQIIFDASEFRYATIIEKTIKI